MESERLFADAALKSIEDLVEQSSYREALREIQMLTKEDLKKLKNRDKAQVYCLTAKCLLHLGEYRKALLKAKVAAYLSRKEQCDSQYARVKFTIGLILSELGRLKEAVEEFNESYVFYKRIRDYAMAVQPLSHLARMHFVAGNLRQCMEVLKLSIEYCLKYLPPEMANRRRRNLARVLLFAGDFDKAGSLLDSCDSSSESAQSDAYIACLRGMRCVFLLDYRRAAHHLQSALDYFVEVGFKRDQAVCMEYLGLNEQFRGNYAEALGYYRQVLDMPEPTASAVAQTLRLMVDVHVAEGKFKKAVGTARSANDAVRKINERIELGALYRAYGQIYSHKSENDVARDYFLQSIDILKETGARYELALTHLACGRSESYDIDERRKHIDMARVLFAEMNVPSRLEQVDEAAKSLRSGQPMLSEIDRPLNGAPVVIAADQEMIRIIARAEHVAVFDLNVLLTGETGVGKDLLAAYIHHCSGREGDFITVNAAAIPNEMIESELFGHTKGAYTGANHDRIGLFQMADGGTIYLNEIADATPEFQAKLLEVVESREIRRLGENRKIKIDFRLIAATNCDLRQRIRENKFRLDLFHRLNEESIVLPSLISRKDDIPVLTMHFIRDLVSSIDGNGAARTAEQLGRILTERTWPGNVRELRSEIRRLWLASHGDLVRMVSLASGRKNENGREQLAQMLNETKWNRREAARRLGIGESTVRYRIKKYGLKPNS